MLAAAVSALLAAGGCAPPFPRELLDKVDRSTSFEELQKDPEIYRGRLLLLGGVIVDARNTKEGTWIEVLQKPLDAETRPLLTDETSGRFLVSSKSFLDAAVYYRGRQITVVGDASGSKTQPLGEIEYRYPVISAKALHLWEPYAGPRVHFGIGVFHRF